VFFFFFLLLNVFFILKVVNNGLGTNVFVLSGCLNLLFG